MFLILFFLFLENNGNFGYLDWKECLGNAKKARFKIQDDANYSNNKNLFPFLNMQSHNFHK